MRIRFAARIALFIVLLAFFAGCGQSTGDMLIGEWIGVKYPSIDWAKISKSADGYVWESPEGKYSAVMEGRMLNIDFEGFPAYATYDKKTKLMNFMVHGKTIEYKRKE